MQGIRVRGLDRGPGPRWAPGGGHVPRGASVAGPAWPRTALTPRYIAQQYRLDPDEIYGHRDFDDTQCPGDVLYGMLPQLRRDVAARL